MIDLLARAMRRVGRVLEPLVDPDAPDRRRRESDAVKRLEQLSAAVSRVADQVDHATRRIDKIDRTEMAGLQHAVGVLERSTRRQATLVSRLQRAGGHERAREWVRDRVLQRLTRLARLEGPLVIGPWTGEVGFELLYWAPFVRWAVRKFEIDPARIIVVSRGGTAAWYDDIGRYVDIFDVAAPDEFRTRTEGVPKKQRWMRQFDRDLVRRVTAAAGLARPAVMHPSLMYALFMPYWQIEASERWVQEFTDFRRLAAPTVAGLDKLPQSYVVARFYFSDCFPETPENRALAAGVIHDLAARTDVVVLGSGIRVDDHAEFTMGAANRIHVVDHLMRPEINLAVQTAVIGRAQAFVGTYGGFAYLAPLCGVPSLAVHSRPTYYATHLGLATTAFEQIGGGSLAVADVATLRRLGLPVALAGETP